MMTDTESGPLRIAMLAPPWIPIPAPAYGGIEEVVRLLLRGLEDRGHRVTLFAAPGSDAPDEVVHVLEASHPDDIQKAQFEADHVARTFAALDEAAAAGDPFDVVHDHVGHTALAMADRVAVPLVHTLHGPFTEDACRFYAQHGRKACIVGISRAQLEDAPPEMGEGSVVHNPIDCAEWPYSAEKGDALLWIGRMSPDKGPHRAIAAARAAGAPLVLAGPVQPGQEAYFAEAVEPHLGRDGIEYVGEADAERKRELYLRSRALLMPIRWPEPFGLVMVEALACGTPVIAFPEGSAPEIVRDGETGFVVDDEDAMAAAIGRLGELDPAACRHACEERFGVAAVVRGYERVYRRAVARPLAAIHIAVVGIVLGCPKELGSPTGPLLGCRPKHPRFRRNHRVCNAEAALRRPRGLRLRDGRGRMWRRRRARRVRRARRLPSPTRPTSSRSRRTCSTTPSGCKGETAKLREDAEAYYALAEAADFDYAKLLASNRAEVQGARRAGAEGLRRRQPGVRGDGGRRRRRARRSPTTT